MLKLRSQLRKCVATFPIYLRKQQRHTASCLNCFRSSNNSNIPKALTTRNVKHPRAHCQCRVGRIEHKHVCFLLRHYLSYSKGIVANASCTGAARTYLHLSIGAPAPARDAYLHLLQRNYFFCVTQMLHNSGHRRLFAHMKRLAKLVIIQTRATRQHRRTVINHYL